MKYELKCKKCNKLFNVEVTSMNVPGGKDREDIICPYCDELNGSEMTSGFVYTYKLDENDRTKENKKDSNV